MSILNPEPKPRRIQRDLGEVTCPHEGLWFLGLGVEMLWKAVRVEVGVYSVTRVFGFRV